MALFETLLNQNHIAGAYFHNKPTGNSLPSKPARPKKTPLTFFLTSLCLASLNSYLQTVPFHALCNLLFNSIVAHLPSESSTDSLQVI